VAVSNEKEGKLFDFKPHQASPYMIRKLRIANLADDVSSLLFY